MLNGDVEEGLRESALQAESSGRSAWLGIELRHLAALEGLAREGSFSAAAEELGYVQSAVSHQIAHLERIVDARLVDRRRGVAPIALTEAGEILLSHFDQIRAELADAKRHLDDLRSGAAGTLRLGADDSVAARLMPTLLEVLAERAEGLQVQIVCSRSGSRLASLVGQNELDAAFCELPLPPGTFQFKHVFDDPYVLIVPSTWEIANVDSPVDPDELKGLTWVGAEDEALADATSAVLEKAGLDVTYHSTAKGSGPLQALVAAGIGASIVPRLAVDPTDDRIVRLDLADLVPPRRLVLIWPAGEANRPALEVLIEIAASFDSGALISACGQ